MAINNFPINTVPPTANLIQNFPHGIASGTNVQVAINQLADAMPSPGPGTDPLALTLGESITAFNPQIGNDANLRRALDLRIGTNSATSNPNFSNEQAVHTDFRAVHGQATNGGITTAKKTFFGFNTGCTYNASGQKFVYGQDLQSYGMSDAAIWGNLRVQFAGGPVNGDEGQGWALVSRLNQQEFLNVTTITSIPTQSTYVATITQAVTASKDSQTVTVNTTVNAIVNDWIVIGQELPSGTPNLEAVQIEAIGGGTITAKFFYNHAINATIKPALVINCASTFQMGQDRVLVNLSATSYSVGTVSSIAGGGFTGTGTVWTNAMVGGNALNIGAISLAADDVNTGPHASTLRSWYQINGVASNTSLGIHTFSVAGAGDYRGLGPGAGSYVISPCARVLRIEASGTSVTGKLICENSTSTWAVGNTVEQVICPYPDVTGFQWHADMYTPGGSYRHFMRFKNNGARKFSTCINIVTEGPVSTGTGANGADTVGFDTVLDLVARSSVGVNILNAQTAAIRLHSLGGTGTPDAGGAIVWDAGTSCYIKPNSTNGGLDFAPGIFGGVNYTFVAPGSAGNTAGNFRLLYNGHFHLLPVGGVKPFVNLFNTWTDDSNYERVDWFWSSNVCYLKPENAGTGNARLFVPVTGGVIVGNLPAAATAGVGARAFVTDATATTFLSVVAGGAANKVPVVSDGTNWLIG